MSFIIVEIPHQRSASAWVAWSNEEIINAAATAENFVYEEYSLQDAVNCYGEEEEIPAEELEILKTGGKVIRTGYNDESELIKFEQAPSELEAAKEALFHDLYTGFILRPDEARQFISEANGVYSGHQCIEAQLAVKKVLSDYFED